MSTASVAAGYPVAGSEPWRALIQLVAEALREQREHVMSVRTTDATVRAAARTAPGSTLLPGHAGGRRRGSATSASDNPGVLSDGGSDGGLNGSDLNGSDLDGSDLDGPDEDPVSDDVIDVEFEAMDADHAPMWTLVRAAQDGDGEAFGRLYDHYVDQVYRFIYYRVNDRALAEDFTSETFLRALRRITTINYQGRDIGAWFMTIARNIVFDHSKSARFRLEMSTGETIESDERAPSPEMMVLASLTNERLLQAVNDLNDEQKECIALRFLHGLSVAETAEVMGKNDGAIKALQHRAVKRLAALIGDDLK